MKDKLKDLEHLASLSVVSIIQFCSDCNCHAVGLTEPNEIHHYINDDVKALLADTGTARQWGILSIGDFERLETEDILLLLQDHCKPEGSPRDPLLDRVIQVYDPGGCDSNTTVTTTNENVIKLLQKDSTSINVAHIKKYYWHT
jgi:hypothetical protein